MKCVLGKKKKKKNKRRQKKKKKKNGKNRVGEDLLIERLRRMLKGTNYVDVVFGFLVFLDEMHFLLRQVCAILLRLIFLFYPPSSLFLGRDVFARLGR